MPGGVIPAMYAAGGMRWSAGRMCPAGPACETGAMDRAEVVRRLRAATRGRYPLASLWIVVAASQALHRSPGFDPSITFLACVIAGYSAAMYSRYRNLALLSVAVAALWVIGDQANENEPSLRPW